MDVRIGQDEVVHYRENGFLAIERLLDDRELEEWREAVDEAVTARPNRRVPHLADAHDLLDALPADMREWFEYYDAVFTQRLFLWKTSERVKQLVFDADLAKLAAELEGADAVRIWQDQALVKEPWGHPTAFHLDGPIFPFNTPRCISLWVALDDATLSNGCLAYLPGIVNTDVGTDIDDT